jgi:hypothetical protein
LLSKIVDTLIDLNQGRSMVSSQWSVVNGQIVKFCVTQHFRPSRYPGLRSAGLKLPEDRK